MSARTGTRRATVLLALSSTPRSAYSLARETGLKESAVEGILDSLSRSNLVEQHPRGWALATGPHVTAALDDACATVRATEQDGVSNGFRPAITELQSPGSLPASSRVTRGPDR